VTESGHPQVGCLHRDVSKGRGSTHP
jgi:hypothetical protein